MAAITLKSLHTYLKLVESAAELKRRLPTSFNPKTLTEGLYETSRLVGVEEAMFKDPEQIAALIGAQRFVMIWGEPSVTDHVERVFNSSRVLLTVLIDPAHFLQSTAGQIGAGPQQGGAMGTRSAGLARPWEEPPAARAPLDVEPEAPPDNLKKLLSGNRVLTGRLFRALFEHMLGFASPSSASQGSVLLVSELTGSREHSRSFLSTALFILGAEVDRDNLMSFMMHQGLFGMQILEHMLQNRDYCDAFYAFRRLGRAFIGTPAVEEAHLRERLDRFNAQFGGKPCGAKIFEADAQDKARIDAYLAASDLLDAMTLTPWRLSMNKAVSLASSYSIRSVGTIAMHFERFAHAEVTKDQANKEIADHLLAFARQFSADDTPAACSHGR